MTIFSISKYLCDQADGIEAGLVGLTLNQTAEWLVDLGAVYAINLDGGGSSTTWYNNTVVNHPTNNDRGPWGERPVTSMVCLKGK